MRKWGGRRTRDRVEPPPARPRHRKRRRQPNPEKDPTPGEVITLGQPRRPTSEMVRTEEAPRPDVFGDHKRLRSDVDHQGPRAFITDDDHAIAVAAQTLSDGRTGGFEPPPSSLTTPTNVRAICGNVVLASDATARKAPVEYTHVARRPDHLALVRFGTSALVHLRENARRVERTSGVVGRRSSCRNWAASPGSAL